MEAITIKQFWDLRSLLRDRLGLYSINIEGISENGTELEIKAWGKNLYPKFDGQSGMGIITALIKPTINLKCSSCSSLDEEECDDRIWLVLKSV